MPARHDYRVGVPKPVEPQEVTGIGQWHDGMFQFAPGHSLADGQFVCPYGNHLVEIEDDWESGESGFYEGFCDVCQRQVEIDYEPSAIVFRAS